MTMTPVELIYGPTMLGILLNILLYGIMITQTYLYLSTFKNDKTWMKAFVYFLFFADTLNSGFDIAFLYDRLVHKFGDVPAIMTADWVFNTDPAMTGIIAFCVQIFFAWRVKLLTQNVLLTVLIIFCSSVQLLSALATAIACGIIKPFVEFQKFQVVVILWLAFAAVADVIIAIALVSHLRKQRTGFAATDDLINKITRMTVQTGAITAIFAIIDLITFLASTSGLHLAFNMPLAKLYTNSLLSTLNARAMSSSFGSASSGDAARLPRAIGGVRAGGASDLGLGGGVWKGPVDAMELEFASKSQMESKATVGDDEERQTGTRVYVNVEEVRESA